MKFSEEQREAVSAHEGVVFEDKLVAELTTRMRGTPFEREEAETRAVVRGALKRAIALGITKEFDAARFAALTCTLGVGFDEQPPFAKVFGANASGRSRMDEASRVARERLHATAEGS